jgi:hypothetical protein
LVKINWYDSTFVDHKDMPITLKTPSSKNHPKRLIESILFFFCIFLTSTLTASAQCNPGVHALKCIEELDEGLIYIKSYGVDGKRGLREKVEYTVVFSNGTQYALRICTGSNDADGIILTIYNAVREPVGSNQRNDEIRSRLDFNCESTGIYYLTFTFQGSHTYCGGCVIALRH